MRRKIVLSFCIAFCIGLASLSGATDTAKSAKKQPVFIKEQMQLAVLMQELTITDAQYEKFKVEYAQIMKRVRALPMEKQAEGLARALRNSKMMKELVAQQQQQKK